MTKKEAKKSKKEETPKGEVVEHIEELAEENQIQLPIIFAIHGDIEESEEITELLVQMYELEEILKQTPEEQRPHVHILISTYGGSIHEMFSIYDQITKLKTLTVVETRGLGKVMSAGVLLLSSGSKGFRKLGKNCRVMLHPISKGYHGTLSGFGNETKETKRLENLYVESIFNETKMSVPQLKKILKKENNTYFSPLEVLELGMVDELL